MSRSSISQTLGFYGNWILFLTNAHGGELGLRNTRYVSHTL